jgi:hypothetical protein
MAERSGGHFEAARRRVGDHPEAGRLRGAGQAGRRPAVWPLVGPQFAALRRGRRVFEALGVPWGVCQVLKLATSSGCISLGQRGSGQTCQV